MNDEVMMDKLNWFGCYDGSWQSAPLVAEAYAHPAKVSFNLAERIYRHMLAEGWLAPGAHVVDPFGGIGGCAFHAALYGMHWTGVELEPKFVALAQQNIDLWRERYAPHFPGYGSARIMQGDSRRLAALVGGADGTVSSPPFLATNQSTDADFLQLRAEQHRNGSRMQPDLGTYGTTPGNLGNLPTGNFDGVVSSPPFVGVVATQDPNFLTTGEQGKRVPSKSNLAYYGSTPGNLGNLPTGNLDAATGYSAAVSSPPYAETRIDGNGDEGASALRNPDGSFLRGAEGWEIRKQMGGRYGDTAGNLGADTDTFWQAAREIVAQTYAVLKPGAVAAWITGDFVRNKKRVPFGEQWLALCESVGFEPLAWATAWKQTDHGAQLDIFGEAIPQTTTRVSFFRRLANAKNPDAAILNEDVIFVRKPGWTGRGLDGAVSSPPFVDGLPQQDRSFSAPHDSTRNLQDATYGTTPGQLGALPAGAPPRKETT